jgi:fatty aldehyde-generating acyl-ACP reductase
LDNFAFIIHPIDPKRDVQRKFPVLGKVLPVRMINFLSRFFPPLYISHITGIRSSATGKEIEGWFVACPFTPQRMMTLPARIVYRKIIATAKKAQSLGAQLVGLGAYTSVVGDGGVTIGHMVEIPVTTGDSYTVAIAIEALKKAAKQMEIDLSSATAAVVGATGTIGAVSAELLAQAVPQIILIGRNSDRLGLV